MQSKPTTDTFAKAHMLLYYAATYPNSVLRCHTSQMVLHIDSDTDYLVMPEAHNFYEGHFYLINWPRDGPINQNQDKMVK